MAWFTAFCTGMAPVAAGSKQLTQLSSSSSSGDQLQVIASLEALGASMTTTAATLKALPAPTMKVAADYAGSVVTVLSSAGPTLSAAAQKIAANPTSPDAGAMNSLMQSLDAASTPLKDLKSLDLPAATQAAYARIPACAALEQATATG